MFAMLSAVPLSAQTTRPTTVPSGDFDVHEWVVIVCSPFQPQASADELFDNTLPSAADSRRHGVPDDRSDQSNVPQPIGVIRLLGTSTRKVDVSLGFGKGRALAAWPHAADASEPFALATASASAELRCQSDDCSGDRSGHWRKFQRCLTGGKC